MIQITGSLFIYLVIANLLLTFLVRILVKKNIFIKSLAFFSIFFQVLVILFSTLRERNFIEVSFGLTLTLLALSSLLIVLIPYLFIKVLTEKKKLQLSKLEDDVKMFLLMSYDDFLEDKPKLSNFLFFLAEKITFCIFKLNQSNLYFLIILIPWFSFISLFFFETVITNKFLFSPYLLVYFFFTYRLFSFLTYLAKNTANFYLVKPLRENFQGGLPKSAMLDFYSLKDMVLNQETKEKKLDAWNNLNLVLTHSCEYFKINLLYYVYLPNLKKKLDKGNLLLIFSSVVFYILRLLDWDLKLKYLSYFVSFLFILYFAFKILNSAEEKQVTDFKSFLRDLPEFLKHFQYVLVTEHGLNFKDLTLGKIDYRFFSSWNYAVINILFIASSILTFVFLFSYPYLLNQISWLCNCEVLIFFYLKSSN